ncbi:MAG: hypothetical protein COA44_06955 [Arcobacter sp.]|nr:MAG: hypothetical protein COA44_06955 [Arcobacter sp.]
MNHKLFTIITIILLSGCSGKNITLQDYADKWFNEKPVKEKTTAKEEISSEPVLEKRETPKKNPAADIAWSSTAKRDVHNKGEGSMQKSLDKWTKEEWDPVFEGDTEQAKKDANASEHFTLQHYMDKRQKYLKSEEDKWEKSGKKKPEANYQKMNKLPVIGK